MQVRLKSSLAFVSVSLILWMTFFDKYNLHRKYTSKQYMLQQINGDFGLKSCKIMKIKQLRNYFSSSLTEAKT